MTKRKASLALDDDEDDNQHDHSPNDVTPRGSCTGSTNTTAANNNNCVNASNITENDNRGDNCSATMSQNGSGGIIADGRSLKLQSSDNQNDNSNSSAGTNNNLTNAGSIQQQNKGKKERADNWSSAEIQVLHRGIESRRDIFYGPPSQATKKNRELAWEAITKEVNAVSSTPRTLSQVMKKFKNEKCRAKRKFIDTDKEGHNNNHHAVETTSNNSNIVSNGNNNNNGTASTTNDVISSLRAQQQATTTTTASTTNHNVTTANQQQQQQQLQQHQAHLMATSAAAVGNGETMTTSQTSSINVVKLAPQNVAKTMIDLPGHVQHTLQMPNDDMVLIVPPDTMDGLLGGVNIVSDGNGHHHFQKCSNTIANQHGHHNQHAIQTLNTNQGLMNGTMGNSMMARTIPAGSMCSLVYSTGNEVCAPEHHITTGQNPIASNHIAVNAQNLIHHRSSTLDQGQQHHQLHHAPHATHQQLQQHQHQLQQQQHPQQQQHSHPQHQQHQHHSQQSHQQHPPGNHNQAHPHHQHLAQNHLASSTTSATSTINSVHSGGAVESQLKNLLFNLLLKDGQHSSASNIINPNQDLTKQRNDMLAIIASSLTKIEGHLSKISKFAGALVGTSTIVGENIGNQLIAGQAQSLVNSGASVSGAGVSCGDGSGGSLSISASDNNNNSFNISNSVSDITANRTND